MPRAIRIFTFRGIPVRLHWAWLAVGAIQIWYLSGSYSSPLWNVAEYLTLFVIVLLHEFGHAFACRQTGGQVDSILLWPLGGVARVAPPQRPGAQLWAIAAGPLVNLALAPVTIGLYLGGLTIGLGPDLVHFLGVMALINLGLFVFNMLPIYPLDGGQILRSLLWYVLGRDRSLTVAATIGLVASVTAGIAAVVALQDLWIGVVAAYAAWSSWRGLQVARARTELAQLPRHPAARCPHCGEAPPDGVQVRCPEDHRFSPYQPGDPGRCPQCGFEVPDMPCLHCGRRHRPTDAVAGWGARLDALRPASPTGDPPDPG